MPDFAVCRLARRDFEIMKKFVTQYKINGTKYGSHIYAKNLFDAESFARMRCMGEKILGESESLLNGYGKPVPDEIDNPDFRNLSDYEFLHRLPQIIHSAIFLGYVAIKSGRATVEILSDEGIIHQLNHLLNGDVDKRKIRRARGKFMSLQNLITENWK